MKKPSRSSVRAALALIGVSFVVCAFIVVADVGIWNTPYETTDSVGRRMGFNDPLSREHWGILLSNFRVSNILAPSYAYSWLLLVVHGLAAGLLLRCNGLNCARVRWFFGLQAVLFPLGWLGFLFLPMEIRWLLNGTFDREAMIDVPFIALTAQPVWLACAMTIFAFSWSASRMRVSETSERGSA